MYKKYTTVSKSIVSLRNCLKIQCLTTQLSPNLVCHYATVTKILVLLRNCHQNIVSFGGDSKVGKPTSGRWGPRARRLLSYILLLWLVAVLPMLPVLLCCCFATSLYMPRCIPSDAMLVPSWSVWAPFWYWLDDWKGCAELMLVCCFVAIAML